MEFVPSKPLTVGVELELQLIDKTTFKLINGIQSLLDCHPGTPYIKPEFIQNTVEVISKAGENTAQVHAHLVDLVKGLRQSCLKLGMDLCAAGTHPFDRELALFTPLPRYLKMEKATGYLGHNQITFATQVHIGVQDAEEAIYLMNAFKAYLPILIALSASSPFWRGYDSGFVSYRHRILAATRSYGIPPAFSNWLQFIEFYNASQRAGMFHSINDIHWDIRVRPQWGTIEIRVMDAQPTITEAMQLASFIRILACYLLRQQESDVSDMPHALPWWFEKDNYYMASRLGFEANYVVDKDGSFKPIYEIWQLVQTQIQPYASALDESAYFNALIERIVQRRISYQRQRKVYKETGSFVKVVSELINELNDDLVTGQVIGAPNILKGASKNSKS